MITRILPEFYLARLIFAMCIFEKKLHADYWLNAPSRETVRTIFQYVSVLPVFCAMW